MCKEQQIAQAVINSHIDSGKSFTYEELMTEILQNGGILRVSIGMTIRMYLKNLNNLGLIQFDSQRGAYNINKNALMEHQAAI